MTSWGWFKIELNVVNNMLRPILSCSDLMLLKEILCRKVEI